jgi:hypothetical protein
MLAGVVLGAPLLDAPDAAAQTISIDENDLLSGIGNGGDGAPVRGGQGGVLRPDGGHGGDGGTAVLHDVGTSNANASSSVITGDITTGDVHGHEVLVDAAGATRPVVTLVAGSFGDTGVDIFAPGGTAQSGTTGGNSNAADASGGAGGDATARGGDGSPARGGTGGRGGSPCVVLLVGCISANLDVG